MQMTCEPGGASLLNARAVSSAFPHVQYSADAAFLFHLRSRGCRVCYSTWVGTAAQLHLWLISEQFSSFL